MIAAIIRVLILMAHAHAAWPDAPLERIAVAAIEAVGAETSSVDAAMLLAIAQHESDLRPNTVSYVVNGKRVDGLWTTLWIPPDGKMTCGYGQSVAHGRAECAAIIADHGGMTAAAAEISEAMVRCHRSMPCALSLYAGGNAGILAWRMHKRTSATEFAALFIRRAQQLGMERPAS